MPKRNAVALRAFTHGSDEQFAADQPILGLDAGQFVNWEHAGLIREATAAEVAKARGEKTASKSAAKRPRTKKAKPAPAAPEPATEAPTVLDPAEQA